MTLAEKLQAVAQNEQKVYDAGFAAGQAQGGGSGEEWTQYAQSFSYTFGTITFPENYELVMTVPSMNSATNIIYGAINLKKLTLLGGDSTGIVAGSYCFMHSSIVEMDFSNFRNGGIQFGSTAKYPFYGCARLKYIRGEIDMSIVTSALNYFNGCGQLVEVRFKAGTISVDLSIPSANLSTDSIQSIIDGLADLTGQTAQTLTLANAIGNKLTDAQKATATAKNWTLVY